MNRIRAPDLASESSSPLPIAEPSYPPIADYAAIGDGRTVALVSRAGAIEWLCLPHFSAPSVFAAMLDRSSGGVFAIAPELPHTSTRRYVDATNVLETTYRTATGSVRITDFMPMPANARRLEPMREVLRLVEGIEGSVTVRVIVDPRPNYGRSQPRLRPGASGCTWSWGNELLTLKTDAPLPFSRVTISAGSKYSFSLCYTKGDIGVSAPLGAASEQRLATTLAWWSQWTGCCSYDGPYRDVVIRSALALKLMTYSLSGGVIAAPTTSLPETLGSNRNWDYRYCWLRDAALTMRAFTGLGFMDEARAFFAWLVHTTRLTWPRLQVLYDVHGRTHVPERELSHWEGYARSQPVRIGNGAARQLQLDTYGGVLSAALDYVRSGGKVQADEARVLAGFGRSVLECWAQPDNGIWEIRGGRRDYTLSKVWCWVALDCLLDLQQRGIVQIDTARVRSGRNEIARIIESRGFNSQLSSYVQTLDGDRVDAGLLLMPCLGYKHPNDMRMRNTYDRIRQRLGRNELLYRYEADVDRLPPGEGAFGICSFWAIDYLVGRGDVAAARQMFERMIARANDLGLFAEEIDPRDGSQLGNFPQAFTHVGLIFAALSLARREERKR
ncbi:MAG TPA: glycoside hydrolase family 15 protein [Steroidobacteraceae bacterium]|nr:glycoside hydrolase family 15 protein [Steroidobacteraceae bacterium]